MIRPVLAAFAVLAGLLAFLPTPDAVQAQPKAKGKRLALLVGVNEYDNRNLEALRFAEADVKDLAAVLKKSGYEVRLLLGSDEGEARATAKNVRSAFDALLDGVTKDDTLLIGMSGHGVQLFVGDGDARKETPFFCPRDAVPTEPAKLVSLADMLRRLDSGGGGHNLLLVDACRNIVDPNKGSRGIEGDRVKDLGVNTVAFFSCGSRQRALETDKAGSGHGVFFHWVLEGLKGKAADAEGRVTFDGLLPFVRANVKRSLPEWFAGVPEKERQKPVAMGNFDDDVVLLDAGSGDAGRPKAGDEKEVEIYKGVTMWFCWVPAGKAKLGSPNDEKGRYEDETPRDFETKGFWMGKYEMTQGQYEAVTGTNPSKFRTGGENAERVKGVTTSRFPVEGVSWDDCQACVKKLTASAALGRGEYDLPHEDEWEYACRAGTKTAFSFGSNESELAGYAWFGHLFAEGSTHETGKKKPNPWGLCDMHGNVMEWCENWYGSEQKSRVLRGGSWGTTPARCRSASRVNFSPASRFSNVGFRLVFRPS